MNKVQNLIPQFVEKFFKSCEIDDRINKYSLFLIRQDGVVLYHNNKQQGNALTKSSIGALLGGVWQASKALSDFIPQTQESKQAEHSFGEEFRLSFDTSSKGVYIVPLKILDEELFLGLIYFDEVNPGSIKSKTRELALKLSESLETQIKSQNTHKSVEGKKINDFLFDDITDAEMDHLFSFGK